MPSKTKMKNAAIAARTAALLKISQELLDQLAAGGTSRMAEQISATTIALKKALIERALGAELSRHLAEQAGPDYAASSNHRNGAQREDR